MFDEKDRVLMLFGGPGSGPGDLTLPGGIAVDRSLLPHFEDYVPDGFQADYLVLVSDQFGGRLAQHGVVVGQKHADLTFH